MRYLESIIKLLFLIGSIYFIRTGDFYTPLFSILLVVDLLLGIILFFNKSNPSYRYPAGYKYNNRVLIMRKIEGVLLVIFSVGLFIILHAQS